MNVLKRLTITGSIFMAALGWLALGLLPMWAAEQEMANITAEKTAGQTQVPPGSLVHYTITVQNSAGFPMVNITDTLPAELTLLSASISAGVVVTNGNMITALASLNPNSSVMVYYTAQVTDTAVIGSFITNTAEIEDNQSNYFTSTAVIEIVPPITATADYAGSTKTANRTTVHRSQTIAYTVVISNAGDLDDHATLTDTLPNHLTVTGTPTSNAGGTFTTTANSVVWTGMVTGNTAVTLHYMATVGNNAPLNGQLVNTAHIVGTDASASPSHTVTVIPSQLYLPLIVYQKNLPQTELTVTPLETGKWTLAWVLAADPTLSYEVQESSTADFSTIITTTNVGYQNSTIIEKDPNVYSQSYYRVRPVYQTLSGPWSNIVQITVLPDLTLAASRPNSSNSWTLTLSGYSATSYEIQESQTADFAAVATIQVTTATHTITKSPSYNNVFYYRARAIQGDTISDWSNAVQVIGGYYDDFSNPNSGWALRRTTFVEKVQMLYEGPPAQPESWLVMWISDTWDWGIASPLKPAPSLPYAIEFRSTFINASDLVSGGAVFAGDWNGNPTGCINYDTLDTIYRHTDCFNQFYFANNIWAGKIRTQWERVDQLAWCQPGTPGCSGSPMKRGRFDWSAHPMFDIIASSPPFNDWHTYRIEVRPNEIKYFVDGNLRYTDIYDVRYITQNPYFGVGGTADYRQPSIVRYSYYSVLPLDN